jgi:hypothetical protein
VDKKERDGGWRWERCGGYEWIRESRCTSCPIGLGRPRIGVITRQIGTHTCCIGDGQLHTKFSEVPVSHNNFPNLLPSLSFLFSTLPLPKNTMLSHPSLSLHAMIKSYHRVQHTASTALSQGWQSLVASKSLTSHL